MRIDQFAFYVGEINAEKNTALLKKRLGLENAEWIEDIVESEASVYSPYSYLDEEPFKCRNVAKLQFCYALETEIEILRYLEGHHWHNFNPYRSNSHRGIHSHYGIHLALGEDFPQVFDMQLVQECKTIKHSNPYLIAKKRTYEYRIYKLSPGTYIKYIKRIEANG